MKKKNPLKLGHEPRVYTDVYGYEQVEQWEVTTCFGGAYDHSQYVCEIVHTGSDNPSLHSSNLGFRICRTTRNDK